MQGVYRSGAAALLYCLERHSSTVSPPAPGPPFSPQCYQPAQLNLLHTLANASGCVVILTGDFHFADIKVQYGVAAVAVC